MLAGSICCRAICCTQARPQSNKIRAAPTSTKIAELPRSGSGQGAPVPRKQISIAKAPSQKQERTIGANTPIPSLHFLQLLGPAQHRAQRTALRERAIPKRHYLVGIRRDAWARGQNAYQIKRVSAGNDDGLFCIWSS